MRFQFQTPIQPHDNQLLVTSRLPATLGGLVAPGSIPSAASAKGRRQIRAVHPLTLSVFNGIEYLDGTGSSNESTRLISTGRQLAQSY
jgi:hypothetical protein